MNDIPSPDEQPGQPTQAVESSTSDQVGPVQESAPGPAGSVTGINDPLFVSLSILAGILGHPVSHEALRAGLPVGTSSINPALCLRAAERAGLTARLMRRAAITDIAPITLPCILLLKDDGACVLRAIDDEGIASILLPESGGEKFIPVDELDRDYLGFAIFAHPRFKFDDRSDEVRLFNPKAWFWGTLAKFWPIYIHVLTASVLVNCFAVALPIFIMTVYDRVVPNSAMETLWTLTAGIGLVFGFEFLIRNLRSYFVDIAGRNADIIIASRLLEHTMGMRMEHRPQSAGALANNLREFEALRDFFTSGTLVALVDLPFVFLFITVIWLLAGEAAYVSLAAVPLVLLVGAILQFPLGRLIERTHRENAQKHSLLIETIDGLEAVKTAGAQGRIQRNWERLVGLTAETSRKARLIVTLSNTITQLTVQLAVIATIVYGVYLIKDGALTVGGLVAATMLTSRALAPLGAVSALLTRLQQSRVALKALDTLMKTPLERPPGRNFVRPPILAGQIELKDVTFSYPDQEGDALKGASFHVMAGEKVGIIGRIGSGKSTLLRLLNGLYDPQGGSILFDGIDVRQIDPADLRRQIGFVSQDDYLFYGSVRDNIAIGVPHADDASIMRAANLSGVGEFIRGHPAGLDLPVGERGTRLSGGQRQGIAVARSLLLDPPMLLMDEPTSNMDHASEARLMRNLETILPGKTLILVTHRGSLLDLVDRLVVLDRGNVVADGPKAQVLEAIRDGKVRTSSV